MRLTLSLLLFALGAPLAAAQHTGHAGGHHAPAASDSLRVPTGLSASETAGLLAGAGLGLAKPAELHSYPGPLHVIELADRLALTPAQRATAEALRAEMLARAVPLGEQLVQIERHIDAAFAGGTVRAAQVERMTAHAARVRGELRAVHLTTHLGMRDALTPEQIARYDELRGYAAGGAHDGAHSSHGTHSEHGTHPGH